MLPEQLINMIKKLEISMVAGVPDSTLKEFCIKLSDYSEIKEYTVANEGASIGLAIGHYLATAKPACVYMQNSGIGNAINPITSLAHEDIYDIPILLVIGWRGAEGQKDEPQHKFMGKITLQTLDLMGIQYGIVGDETSKEEIESITKEADRCLKNNKQYAIVVKKGCFSDTEKKYQNDYLMNREKAINVILSTIDKTDIVISTTGKISREVYEQSQLLYGQHAQEFLTVGGMGHASMIAMGVAMEKQESKVICLDGDGAALMHMGNLAVIGKNSPNNLLHICLNNDAHESVGGMKTGAVGLNYAEVAKVCGYEKVKVITTEKELKRELDIAKTRNVLTFLEIKISIHSRENLARPIEAALQNKLGFMKYHNFIQ